MRLICSMKGDMNKRTPSVSPSWAEHEAACTLSLFNDIRWNLSVLSAHETMTRFSQERVAKLERDKVVVEMVSPFP